MDVLDNLVWHALTGPQATVAEGDGRARRYHPDVSVFAGVPDEPGAESWDGLRDIVGPGGAAVLVRDAVEVPRGWTERFRAPGTQMVCDHPVTAAANDAPEIVPLHAADVPEMVELVDRTRPGPFLARTIELGGYYGMRDAGALVAMAGIRMHLPGFSEISAVCTDESYRGRGLASVLVARLVDEILERDEVACLHAVSTNTTAIRLYETLGFTTRREMDFALLSAPD